MTTTRHEEIRDSFIAYHAAHPEVWDLFARLTRDRIGRGYKHYSADAILHRIRWELSQPTYEAGEEFKINNNFAAFYARWFMREFPQHDGFFRTRALTSIGRDATGLPELRPSDFQ